MIQGSLVAIVTPMHADGGVDEQAFRRLIDWHVEQGTDAIVAVGTTGESATLDEHEHCAAIALAVEQTAGRIPVIAGTGANSTSEAISLTRCALDAGADACLLVTPYYNKPTQEGLYRHHRAVAEAVPIPQVLYNVPGRTAVDMLPETVARLAEIDNIVGVKEATGKLDRITRLRELSGADFAVYSGDDATAREAMLLGANGDISVTANVAPAAMHAMCVAALAGDRTRAEELDRPLSGLHRELFAESNPIPVKWALAEMGMIETGIRLPLTWLADAYHVQVRDAMRQAGISI
ncbi:MAG: 4-hydroxy-tetrahydrodipicolinate synthase [Gammaproteobacteria bacterium]|nr:4-hydroxy-tetrahydrodipicolinate synthase [Gammaproteobacteria bacterium]MCP5298664.1 4-hydroxy-tetrahydrodipicolinate synthase [Chromatiaceae bacterium]